VAGAAARCRAPSTAAGSGIEDAHADEVDLLGDVVGRAADRPCDMGAVPVAVVGGSAVDGVVVRDGAARELLMAEAQSRVDDVRLHARARHGVRVRPVQREAALIDAVQAPGWSRLRRGYGDDGVGLDVCDVRIVADIGQRCGRKRCGVALQR
jgi:hypothetical protein